MGTLAAGRDFVEIGCSVLLSDTDVVYLKNPFQSIFGDSDVEGMSDGWDNSSAHGFFDRVDGRGLSLAHNLPRVYASSQLL